MTERPRSTSLRKGKDHMRYRETETAFMTAIKDIKRLVVDAPNFLPAGKTDVGRVLDNAQLLSNKDYVQNEVDLLTRSGLPPDVVQAVMATASLHTTSFASTHSAVATGTEKAIFVNADHMRGRNKTFFVQVLLEELAHAYAKEERLGMLRDVPNESGQYFPLASKREILQWIRTPRNEMGITHFPNQQHIAVHRAGCLLLFEEATDLNSGDNGRVMYGMPSGHQALEETRASILQAIFMAKYLGGNALGTSYDRVTDGLRRMHEGGWVNVQRKGYSHQALGFGMVVPVVLAMATKSDPSQELSRSVGRLHDMNYDQLKASEYAQVMSGNIFQHAIEFFAGAR